MNNTDFTRFWRAMLPEEKRDFADKVGCAFSTLSQIASKTKLPSKALEQKIIQSADGKLDNVELRPQHLLKKLRHRATNSTVE